MPKHLFEYTVEEMDTAIGMLSSLTVLCAQTFEKSLKENGPTSTESINAHDHMTHVGNTIVLLKKVRSTQAGEA